MFVHIYYPKRHFTGYDFSYSQTITQRIYDESGEFLRFEYLTPSIDYYEKVSCVEFPDGISNDQIFYSIVSSHNIGSYPTQISERIRSGDLTTEHSSFSVGDVIQIGGCFYISTGYEFVLLPLEFSNSLTTH
jgi:hypothetical protein